MSVKIARLKGGEDVIADIKEVSAKEDENKTAIAFMFRDPYVIILDDQSELEMEMWGDGDEEMEEEKEILASNKEAIEKNPNLILYPWAPLATNRDFYIRLEEVVTVYDPHGQVTEKYTELIEVKDGESKDSSS
tara:strand:- start:252 stop:653 length:402 start_codon:yes stop_codon:yes gene_type:complete